MKKIMFAAVLLVAVSGSAFAKSSVEVVRVETKEVKTSGEEKEEVVVSAKCDSAFNAGYNAVRNFTSHEYAMSQGAIAYRSCDALEKKTISQE